MPQHSTKERHPETGSRETRKDAKRLMAARDTVASAESAHEKTEAAWKGLDGAKVAGASKVRLDAHRAAHDEAELDAVGALMTESSQAVTIHHGDRDVYMFLDEDDDDALKVADLGDVGDDEDLDEDD